ncbi:calcium-translocating P-type ATPase, PMCA-type [Lutispora saccharofermentans]|uniref:P-type Ca(2+) transporter n=1 Tax=Lutispora saccharofermentans TaxID=3024236 RepID=A0ABT1NHC9_9FIRM|nr:calcium-translocating P-type ATPase, PMCA-type [Lutispora saccharofermentans]MCQ1530617.1 calcium-translocating P-type ATPase, PMCA-type [Lutispora saccharofermentans]
MENININWGKEPLTKGLSEKEALEKLKKHGFNELIKKNKKGPITIFAEQFKNLMTLVLIGAALISWFFGERADAITILAIIVLNSILGFIQEFKAERSIEALMELSAPGAKVVREGKLSHISAKYVVPGDLLLIEAGDRIPADGIVLECTGLMVDESLLTGESVPVEKKPRGSDRVFMGTISTSGKAKVVTYSTGMNTEMGKIANMLQEIPDEYTPLQRRLAQLGKYIVAICLIICAVVSITGIMRGEEPYNMLLTGISLAVAAIPEGLPAIVTVALAIGVQRMYKRNALVRKLPAVETLGSTTVICSDKTGTLTQNKMTVKKLYIGDKFIEPQKDRFPSSDAVKLFFTASAVCNDAFYEEKLMAEPESSGDPTELAILKAAWTAGIKKPNLDKEYKRIHEIPFDSDRKRMTVAVKRKNGESYVFVKGAVDIILGLCSKYYGPKGEQPMTYLDMKNILSANERMASSALRVLGAAYKKLDGSIDKNSLEKDLIFLGMTGMIDPPRPEAAKAVETCIMSGIRPVMITGDHKMTAAAIGKELGILTSESQILAGSELDKLSDKQLEKASGRIAVYARVSPKHKLRIVKALKASGHTVAMTGDGVNDAPAIKEADIGISMGITGTDVTKEASSMVLLDDNFSTIVAAVEEGRIIYDNIRKFIRYLLSCNIGEVLTMFLASLLYMPVPLIPIQILWVNLVTDGLPAMALGIDPPDNDIMRRRPRSKKEGIFSEGLGLKILMRGIAIGLGTLSVYALMLYLTYNDIQRARTCAFASLVLSQLSFVFECRSEHRSILKINPLTNIWLILAVLCSLGLLLMVIYVPFFHTIFDTVALRGIEWIIVVSMSLIWTIVSVFTTKKKRR